MIEIIRFTAYTASGKDFTAYNSNKLIIAISLYSVQLIIVIVRFYGVGETDVLGLCLSTNAYLSLTYHL